MDKTTDFHQNNPGNNTRDFGYRQKCRKRVTPTTWASDSGSVGAHEFIASFRIESASLDQIPRVKCPFGFVTFWSISFRYIERGLLTFIRPLVLLISLRKLIAFISANASYSNNLFSQPTNFVASGVFEFKSLVLMTSHIFRGLERVAGQAWICDFPQRCCRRNFQTLAKRVRFQASSSR